VWVYGREQTHTQRDTHRDTQMRVTTIHFASSTTHAKCNNVGEAIAQSRCQAMHAALMLTEEINLLEVEGASAPVPHSWRRQWV